MHLNVAVWLCSITTYIEPEKINVGRDNSFCNVETRVLEHCGQLANFCLNTSSEGKSTSCWGTAFAVRKFFLMISNQYLFRCYFKPLFSWLVFCTQVCPDFYFFYMPALQILEISITITHPRLLFLLQAKYIQYLQLFVISPSPPPASMNLSSWLFSSTHAPIWIQYCKCGPPPM